MVVKRHVEPDRVLVMTKDAKSAESPCVAVFSRCSRNSSTECFSNVPFMAYTADRGDLCVQGMP